jgi:hypothetical protein
MANNYESDIIIIMIKYMGEEYKQTFTLTFGDVDGDNDDDMIVGDASGNIHLFSNIASSGSSKPNCFILSNSNYLGINVGSNATPQLVDVDRDGQIDLLIGERNGNINYYRNNGNFTFSFITATMALIKLSAPPLPRTIPNS